ncbi:MAG: glycosyltransferase [Saprospiraceae bacterium]|nr:glycosyltransferase [Saprospiraceae bacterium]
MNEVYGIANERMEILPLGFDDEFATDAFKELNRKLIRSKYSLPESSRVIFTGGKINSLKRLEDLIDAIDNLKDSDLVLLLVGKIETSNSEYEKSIKSKIQSNNKIIHVGWVCSDDVYKYMAASDLAVFPASQSVLWQQSMGMGLVTIIGKFLIYNDGRIIDQHVEYLNQNNNIIILESRGNKTSEITNKLRMLLNDKEYYLSIKKNNADFSKNYLSYESIVKQTLMNV